MIVNTENRSQLRVLDVAIYPCFGDFRLLPPSLDFFTWVAISCRDRLLSPLRSPAATALFSAAVCFF